MGRVLPALIAAMLATPAAASDLIGTIVPPYPDGFTSDMGTCLPGPGSDDICAYSIATLNDASGDVTAILASRLSHRDDSGEAFWEILDITTPPLPGPMQTWAMELCHVDRERDAGTIGIVAYRDAGGWIETEDTLWAIRFDVEAGYFTNINPARVRCELPGS